MDLSNKIFSIENDDQFSELALAVFSYQYQNNLVYREFVDLTGNPNPNSIEEITFLPISFFKNRKVLCNENQIDITFKSSGTGGERSTHYVADLNLYEQSFLKSYTEAIGDPKDQVILALLPNYLEQGDSSLIYMVNHLINLADDKSAFLLGSLEEVHERYYHAIQQEKQVVIFGVSYALLDLAAMDNNFSEALIIETGGMKGTRKEISKQELHAELSKGLKTQNTYSEYGMTELLSQSYASSDLIFHTPSWMKVLIRDVNDPLELLKRDNQTGGINVIDLANTYSCSFIATQDLGRIKSNGFELMGRFDHSDIRGCNLLVQ